MNTNPEWHFVFFHPWIGESYENPRFKCRLLLLGESHYGTPENQIESFTQDLTSKYVARTWSHRFWTDLSQTVLGMHHTEFARSEFWNDVAFYNYVQQIVTDGKTPTDANRIGAGSAFAEILERLQPNLVIACGQRLKSWLPDNYRTGEQYASGSISIESRYYALSNGDAAELVPINHPSSIGFHWRDWHPIIKTAHNNVMHRSRRRCGN